MVFESFKMKFFSHFASSSTRDAVFLGLSVLGVPFILSTLLTLTVAYFPFEYVEVANFLQFVEIGLVCVFLYGFLRVVSQLMRLDLPGSLLTKCLALLGNIPFREWDILLPAFFLFVGLFFYPSFHFGFYWILMVLPFLAGLVVIDNYVTFQRRVSPPEGVHVAPLSTDPLLESLSDWGQTLGFSQVHLTLLDLPSSSRARFVWGNPRGTEVSIVYSQDTYTQADFEQRLIFCVREICRVSVASSREFFLVFAFYNLVFMSYFGLIGVLVVPLASISPEKSFLFCIFAILVYILADTLFKVFIGVFEKLVEFKANQKTVLLLASETRPAVSIQRILHSL